MLSWRLKHIQQSTHSIPAGCVSLVVKASTSRAEDPGFISCLRWNFSGVESYQWLKNGHSSGYPASWPHALPLSLSLCPLISHWMTAYFLLFSFWAQWSQKIITNYIQSILVGSSQNARQALHTITENDLSFPATAADGDSSDKFARFHSTLFESPVLRKP